MTLIPLLAALGVFLIYSGITSPPEPRRSRFSSALSYRLVTAGYAESSPILFVGIVAGAAFATFVLAAGVTSSTAVGLALGVLAATVPFSYLRAKTAKRLRRFRDAWPDALATLVASVRAGVSLPEACTTLLTRGPEELRDGFSAFVSTYRSTGSFTQACVSLRDELADPIADRVVASLLLAHEVGGSDLVRVLRTTSDFVLEDARVRKEIEARWSWTVTAARVAAAAPWLVLVMMATRPEAARAYDSSTGAFVIAAGALSTFVGYRAMLRAGRLPEERRLS